MKRKLSTETDENKSKDIPEVNRCLWESDLLSFETTIAEF